jgi:hypothetical protein
MVVEAGMANKPGWKDVSSYSRGDREKGVPPSSFELAVGKLRLVVTRHIHYDPTDWVLRMEGIFETTLKGDRTAEFAKANCLMLARDYLRDATNAITLELETSLLVEVVPDDATPKAQPMKSK